MGATLEPAIKRRLAEAESLAAVVVDGGRSNLYLPPNTTTLPHDSECLGRLDKLLGETSLAQLDEQMNISDSTTVAGRGDDSYTLLWIREKSVRRIHGLPSMAMRVRSRYCAQPIQLL